MLTSRDVNEIAEVQPGVIQPSVTLSQEKEDTRPPGQQEDSTPVTIKAPRMSTASIGSDGKVTFKSIDKSEA